ncbi:hypothetical protein Avbf_10399 [Armadillidium vulgare]|nr:hypothetical protein Avbf_10399 [Armadillidium vulgare]
MKKHEKEALEHHLQFAVWLQILLEDKCYSC